MLWNASSRPLYEGSATFISFSSAVCLQRRRSCGYGCGCSLKLTDLEDLCIPPHNFPLGNFYLLTRSVIIRHLTYHLPKSHPEIEIHNFSSVHDPTFEEYVKSIGIYFIMCYDGARTPIKFAKKRSMLGVNDGKWQKVAFRKAIRRFISSGFNMTLINGLEVRDIKVRRTFQIRLMAYTHENLT
jgi:hypothetical protein